jgi:hypothetical protein
VRPLYQQLAEFSSVKQAMPEKLPWWGQELTFELFGCVWIVLILVWMPFQGLFAICLFDLILGGIGFGSCDISIGSRELQEGTYLIDRIAVPP